MVVLGQLATGADADAARSRHGDGAGARTALRGRRARVRRLAVGAGRDEGSRPMSGDREIAVLGVGMHPWGKWGRNFVEYGVVAAQAALADAGVEWRDVQFVVGRRDRAQRLPRLRRGRDVRAGARLERRAGRVVVRRVRVGRHRARRPRGRRSSPGFCDVALVVGADTTPKGFLAPNEGERGDDPDWLRFRLLGATNPTYFGLYAAPADGAVRRDPRGLRARQGEERAPRPRATRTRATARRSAIDDVLTSPLVVRSAPAARHLRDERRRRRDRRREHRLRARRTAPAIRCASRRSRR